MARVTIWVLLFSAWVGPSNGEEFALRETDGSIEILGRGKLLLRYNKVSPAVPDGIDSVFQRTGFLHPVCSPDGKTVTASFPFDHPHQQGVFSAWVKTKYNGRDIDFWNLKKGTGRVVHRRVLDVFCSNQEAGFTVELVHRTELVPAVDVLSETWTVTAVPTDGSFHCFDLETTQQALTKLPLRIAKFHYGGIAVRGPVAWLRAKDSDSVKEHRGGETPAEITNSFGSDRLKGNHEKPNWVTMSGAIQGNPVSVTVLCGQASFRAPQATRLHPTKPYFCFCPAVEEDFVIDQQNPYEAKYRFLVRDSEPDREWVERHWRAYARD